MKRRGCRERKCGAVGVDIRLLQECLVLIRALMQDQERELLQEISGDNAASSAGMTRDKKQGVEAGLPHVEATAQLPGIPSSTFLPEVGLKQVEALRREEMFVAMQRKTRPGTVLLPQAVSAREAVAALATTIERYHRPEDHSTPLEHE